MAPDKQTARNDAGHEGRATVEWCPIEVEQLRVSRVVYRSLSEVERDLRIRPEQVLQFAYGESIDPDGAMIALAPYPKLPWVRVPVRVESFTPVADHHGIVISIRWTANKLAHLLPRMDGDLLVLPGSGESCELVLDGRYRPPLGLAGLILDRLVGRWVASTTAKSFVDHLVDYIERPAP